MVPVLSSVCSGTAPLRRCSSAGSSWASAGTAFAVGVPFVNAWFPPEPARLRHRRVRRRHGRHRHQRPDHAQSRSLARHGHTVRAHRGGPRAVYGVLAAPARCATHPAGSSPASRRSGGWPTPRGSRSPGRRPRSTRSVRRLRRLLRLPADVPEDRVRLTQTDAANRMAGFVLLAVLLRPLGGWLSDRCAPLRVLGGAFARGLGPRRRPVLHPGAGPGRHHSPSWMAGRARCRQSGAVFALVAQLARRARSARSPVWSAPPAVSAASSRRW